MEHTNEQLRFGRSLQALINAEHRRKLIGKSFGETDDGWLIMGYVTPAVCASCKVSSFTMGGGLACPHCGSHNVMNKTQDGADY